MAAQLDPQKLLEKMEQLPKQARYGVLAGTAVLVCVLYYFTLYGSVAGQLKTAEGQLAKLQGEVAQARTVANNLSTFRAKSEELKRKFETARSRLPNATELPVLLTDISSLGKKAGLELGAFKPADEVQKDFYAEVPIDVQFSGTYHEIGMFFDKLSKLSRIVNVSEFAMVLKKQGDSEEPILEVKGVATTFRFLDKKKEGAS